MEFFSTSEFKSRVSKGFFYSGSKQFQTASEFMLIVQQVRADPLQRETLQVIQYEADFEKIIRELSWL